MQYVFGNVNDTNLKINTLWFLHAKTMIADESLYENIFDELQGSLRQTHFNNSDTDELARFNNIDPLKITSLKSKGNVVTKPSRHVFKLYFYSYENTSRSYFI